MRICSAIEVEFLLLAAPLINAVLLATIYWSDLKFSCRVVFDWTWERKHVEFQLGSVFRVTNTRDPIIN
jgi:hypothetical protein